MTHGQASSYLVLIIMHLIHIACFKTILGRGRERPRNVKVEMWRKEMQELKNSIEYDTLSCNLV